MKKHLSILLFLLLWITSGVMAGNLPFPQNATYPYGIKAATPNTTKIASLYNAWVNTFYKEGSATVNGSTVAAARIDYDDPGTTVSEGVGYGLLIFVYMDGVTETNSFSSSTIQSKFDKLYNYYSAWSKYSYGSTGRKYLMNWKINGFSSITSANSATDAELDVALALLMAHKQWGSTGTINYAAEAENLLAAIYDKEVDGSSLLKPGDVWNDVKNPCYFETAALQLFNIAQTSIGFTNKRNWASVYSASNTFLSTKAQNTTTGLFPDWCSTSGTAVSGYGYDYSWDACRTPWRVAWDYAWWGSTEASTMSGRTSSWLKSSNISASSCATGYTITGSALVTSYQSPCFVGGLASSFMASSANSTNLQTWYDQNLSLNPVPASGKVAYYGKTLQILYALTMSGNTPNFYGTTSTTAPTLSSAVSSVDGLKITLSFTKAMSSLGIANYKNQFQVKVNGTAITLSTLKATSVTSVFDLTLGKALVYGDVVTISYTGSSIQDADGNLLATFSNTNVTNNVSGGTTIIADCEDVNKTKMGTFWYSYNDNTPDATTGNAGASIITPLASKTSPFTMTKGGANGTDSAAVITYSLNKGTLTYDPFVGFGFAMSDPEAAYDLTGSTGISFYHKGDALVLQVALSTNTDADYYTASIASHADWTLVSLPWSTFAQSPDWGTNVAWNPAKIVKFQWQRQTTTGTSGTIGIDEVQIDGKSLVFSTTLVKTALTAAISAANTALVGTTEGTAVGNYPVGSKNTLTSAITAATTVSTTATTQKQIDDAVIAINSAVVTFKNSVITTVGLDKSALISLLSTANTTYTGATEGTAIGNYPSGSKATLLTAINSATTISSTATTQKQIDDAVISLNTALTNFNALKISSLSTLIADCEDANMTKLSTAWYSYADKTTTISPASSKTVPFTMTKGGANNTDSAAIVSGYLAKPEAPDYESAGIGFTFKDPQADYDLTGATGISFWHKGDAVTFSVMLSTVTADKGYDYSYAVPSHIDWTLVEVKFSDPNFAQPNWLSNSAPTEIKTWDPSKITKIQWQIKDGVARNYTFGIDEVQVDGKILVLSTTTLVKTALTAAIASANTAKTGVSEGTAIGNVPVGSLSALNSAISTASGISTTATTQKQIDDAVIALNAAIKTFNDSKITTVALDKSALTTAIASANTAKTGVSEGSAIGNVPVGSLSALNSAISTASGISTTATTQKQIDDAVIALNVAVKLFNDSKITSLPVSKTALELTITSANALLTIAKPGDLVGQYPQASITTFSLAIDAANSVDINPNASQSEVNVADDLLKAAIVTFNASKNTATTNFAFLNATIATASTLSTTVQTGTANGNVSAADKKKLSDAIAVAQIVAGTTTATQAQVNDASKVLSDAITAFNNSIINITGVDVEDAVSVSLYPTVLKEKATITVTGETIKAVSFYSITGQIVKTELIETSSLQVSTSELTTGVYFVQIKLANGDVKTIKAIKE